jgi:uncharacterized Zn-finger protein
LPSGLNLSGDEIYGTPTGSGQSTFTVQVSDQTTPTPQTATATFSITIELSPLSVTTTSLSNGTESQSYNQFLTSAGGIGSDSWEITSGSLPSGLNLSGDEIYGTPTGSGQSTFTVQVSDQTTPTPQTATATLSITIDPSPLSVTTTSLSNGTESQSYNQFLTSAGGAGSDSWEITSGSLPAGLNLSSDEIYGTPTGSGQSTFTVQVSDQTTPTPQTATATLSITIEPSTLAISTSSLPGGTQGYSYDQYLVSLGGYGNDTWTIKTGGLPAGLTLYSGGEIYGTPSGSGKSNFSLQVTDQTSPTPQMVTVPLSITISKP